MSAVDVGDPTDAEDVLERVDIFRAAYALVRSLEWERGFDVLDVTRVAEFLEER